MGYQVECSLGGVARGNIEADSFTPLLASRGAVCALTDRPSAVGLPEDSKLDDLTAASEAACVLGNLFSLL